MYKFTLKKCKMIQNSKFLISSPLHQSCNSSQLTGFQTDYKAPSKTWTETEGFLRFWVQTQAGAAEPDSGSGGCGTTWEDSDKTGSSVLTLLCVQPVCWHHGLLDPPPPTHTHTHTDTHHVWTLISSSTSRFLSSSAPLQCEDGLAVHQQGLLPGSLLEPVRQVGPVRPAHHPELLGHLGAGGALRHQAAHRLGVPPGPGAPRQAGFPPAARARREREPGLVPGAGGQQAPGGLPALPQRDPIQAGL